MRLSPSVSLGEAKALLRARFMKPGGEVCPCCGQVAAMRRRNIHATMASALCRLYVEVGDDWGHVPSICGPACEIGKTRYWGLIEEEHAVRPDGGRAGWWRLTPKGVMFVCGELSVPKYARVFNGDCYGLNGPAVTIRDCLADRFSYSELMGRAA